VSVGCAGSSGSSRAAAEPARRGGTAAPIGARRRLGLAFARPRARLRCGELAPYGNGAQDGAQDDAPRPSHRGGFMAASLTPRTRAPAAPHEADANR
jgi:hypothetical protein